MINSNNHCDYSDKMQKCQDYIHALQEEHKKIQVFQRELPLCLELVTQAIEACKQRLSGTSTEYNLHGESECSEQVSSEGPTLEEFIPIKRALSTSDDDDDEDKSQKPNNKNSKNTDEKSSKKSDWLRSVGLWNQTPNPTPEEDLPKKKSSGAFHPFKKEKSVGTESTTAQGVTNRSVPLPPEAANSTAEKGGGSKKGGPSGRKARRTWSPELHKRFLQALEQLGGSHVATPKQIREFMKVDGLTNDEVKSHLQKYRLHTRRSPNHSLHSNNNPQQPQFVVVGGIWVPPPEYAAMAATTASWEASGVSTASNRIYTPIAKLPPPFPGTSTSPKRRQQHKRVCSDDRGSHSEGGDFHSHSPAGSCSTHTTNTLSTH